MKIFLDKIALKLGYVPDHIERTLSCAWCAKQFKWSGRTTSNHAIYCSPLHKKRAHENRTKRKEAQSPKPTSKKPDRPPVDLNKVGRCPTPYKQTHVSFEKAREVIRRVDPMMHPYRCPCGGIHIGH